MKFGDLTLQQVTFEVRYESAYRLWDNAGAIWTSLTQKFGAAEPVTVKPSETTFKIGEDLVISVQMDKASLTVSYPKGLEEFQAQVQDFAEIVISLLELSELKRVGTRIILSKKFADKGKADEEVFSTGILSTPNKKILNIDGRAKYPEISYRWEDDKLGARIQIRSINEKVQIDYPPEVRDLDPIREDYDKLVVDIDYYTIAVVRTGTFKAGSWIERLRRGVARDFDVLVHGYRHD